MNLCVETRASFFERISQIVHVCGQVGAPIILRGILCESNRRFMWSFVSFNQKISSELSKFLSASRSLQFLIWSI